MTKRSREEAFVHLSPWNWDTIRVVYRSHPILTCQSHSLTRQDSNSTADAMALCLLLLDQVVELTHLEGQFVAEELLIKRLED